MRFHHSSDTHDEGPRHRRPRWQLTLLWLLIIVSFAMVDVSIVLSYYRLFKVFGW
ncbi:MAG: hypothetical protein M0027_16825 [Candidatus Dormibacteraeota bacterium]|nr:hypothetical protein [Candidatus Dormibacteraeota bacterium]